ncbi:AraC family transcriptional regulator [Paeniroseomonas aquatica]|uniref:AraC family transcriptional regulator n=1 Tax=Paeniroseomonas aquatica TaxID=373043 RepID=A0ABT8A2J8_9PROT|nr:AraC family transcriptional regulator [Paeniroseomonas aquatica]MDN3563930.1 AraC family transcriptional regulator [Paeniroseomonas aquatica]
MTEVMDELRAFVMRASDKWTATGLPRVAMVRAEACSDQVYEPMLHLVLQGSKSLSIGNQILRFEAGTYFLVPVDVPAIGQVSAEKPGSPYLALSLTLDPAVIAAMLAELDDAQPGKHEPAFWVSAVTPDLMDAWLRMMRLVDRPNDVAMLAPMIEREILFRVLQGPQGRLLRQIARADSRLSQMRRSVDWIRSHYTEPFRVEPLAAMTGMSVATFYRHFTAMTAMTPIQYQKRLRLLQARRMLLFEPRDAAAIAFSVGYESASQFSREYSRLFGMPPVRDAARFRTPAPSSPKIAFGAPPPHP